MKELIKSLFNKNGFILNFDGIVQGKRICFFSSDYDKSKKSAHYLVIFFEDINQLTSNNIGKELAQYFFRIENNIDTTKEMNKNIYIVVCAKATNLESDIKLNEGVKKAIFDIEEDPYSFKKYVLTYTEDEVEDLKEEIEKNNNNINDALYHLINKSNEFIKFKKNIYESSAYELAIKIFIKLPFMKFDVKKKEMNDLSKNIAEGIRDIGKEEEILVSQITQFSLESIKSPSIMSDEEILKMLGVSK